MSLFSAFEPILTSNNLAGSTLERFNFITVCRQAIKEKKKEAYFPALSFFFISKPLSQSRSLKKCLKQVGSLCN
jgi:hypothetical protein